MARRRKKKSFAPVAREVRRTFRNAELEASRILSDFLGYPVEVRRKRDRKPATKEGDTTNLGKMQRIGKRAARDGYYEAQAPLEDLPETTPQKSPLHKPIGKDEEGRDVFRIGGLNIAI